jgi:hypothetical protein
MVDLYLWGYLGLAFHLLSKFFPVGDHSKKWTEKKKKIAIRGTALAIIAYTILFFGIQEGFGGFFTIDLPMGRFTASLLGLGSSSLLQHWTAKLINEKKE